ncbi:M17 family peptidase N-terminal domain-containing protein [Sandaracinus amylolyticus]|uniref:Cytosol aminopeptidase n=1 Tax=Sandaracinus amylolyticus TaxID=927083 RepID=A0A0F6W448_9BACT|nr:M17 family peptidase N-terminal domain-containing protein [Sandaracinus amylolyticus]AKF06930.1 cytosol aminopeptidase [Sandaracinus amylolyticus]
MELRFVAPDLRALDGLRSEALALPFFQDERPLRGAAGLVDWRLCGRLSRLLVRGRMRGALGERVLIPARPRLAFEKLFLFGLGPRAAFDETAFVASVDDVLDTLEKMRARTAVIALPGRSLELVGPERALELFLSAARDRHEHDELTLIEPLDAQRSMIPVLERARRKARALEGGA